MRIVRIEIEGSKGKAYISRSENTIKASTMPNCGVPTWFKADARDATSIRYAAACLAKELEGIREAQATFADYQRVLAVFAD